MLYQLSYFRIPNDGKEWAVMDSNHRRRKPAELQSAPFGHSGNCPSFWFSVAKVDTIFQLCKQGDTSSEPSLLPLPPYCLTFLPHVPLPDSYSQW